VRGGKKIWEHCAYSTIEEWGVRWKRGNSQNVQVRKGGTKRRGESTADRTGKAQGKGTVPQGKGPFQK